MKKTPDILSATINILERINTDLNKIAGEVKNLFQGLISIITGTKTISGNYFSSSVVKDF